MSEISNLSINHAPSKGELTVLFSGHSKTHSGQPIGPILHDYALIHMIQSGQGTFSSRGMTYELKQGDSFFICPGELVSYQADQAHPWTYRWVAIRGTQSEKLLADIGVGPLTPVRHAVRWKRIERLFIRIEQSLSTGDKMADLEAEAFLRMMLVEYGRSSPQGREASVEVRSDLERQVEEAARFLTLRYTTTISIEELAQHFGYHRTYFSKMFHEIIGETPIQMLIRLRMERARTLLITTKLTVEQIASSVGYSDALYFSKMYKRIYGIAPTSYRKLHQT